MNDNYLWDKSGKDPEIEALERALAPLGYKEQSAPKVTLLREPGWHRSALAFAAAAVFTIVLFAGFPRREGKTPVVAKDTVIDLGRYGQVTARAGARVSVLRQNDEEIRLRLERGTIEASITLAARPGLFQVDTPATTCVDLGCHYTLTVDEKGRSVVHVTTGRVAFSDRGREVYVPAGATCTAVPATGSGTPHWDDASGELVVAVLAFDEATGEKRLEAAKGVARECARAKDALTVWHVMQDGNQEVAELGYRALTNLIGAPRGVTKGETLKRDAKAMEAWKEHVLGSFWK